MPRRSLAVLGWLAVVVVATLAGVGALRLVGNSLAGTPGGVRSQADVARELAAATRRPSPSPSAAAPTPSPPTTGQTETFGVRGGTVRATCADGLVRVVYYAPAPGFSVDDHDSGPDREAEVKFRGPAGRSEIKIQCEGDQPVRVGDDD